MRNRILLAVILLAGCGSSDEVTPTPSGGADSGPEAALDAGADAGASDADAAVDADAAEADASVEKDASEREASPETGGDVTDADAASGDADGADSHACTTWSFWNDGLTGGQVDQVMFDPR